MNKFKLLLKINLVKKRLNDFIFVVNKFKFHILNKK